MARTADTKDQIPSWAIALIFLIMTLAVGLVLTARATNFGVMRHEPSTPVEIRSVLFQDRDDGTLAVYDKGAKEPFLVIPKDGYGFVRGTMRALRHGRRINQASPDTPFELVRWADGRFSLRDPADGREIALEAFGPSNAAEYRRLMALKGANS
jgi:putative photosynthetic complex assembly protein